MLAPKTLACTVQAQPSTRQATAALPKTWLENALRDERRWCCDANLPDALVLILIRLASKQVPPCSLQAAFDCKFQENHSNAGMCAMLLRKIPKKRLAKARSVIKATFS